jgi:RHS repeat-associated protein
MKQFWKRTFTALIPLLFLLGAAQSRAEYEEVIYYHNDALGSPIMATTALGAVKWKESYAPYGSRLVLESRETTGGSNPAQIESQWDEKQWYTGKLEETRVGLQYFGARWYEPEIGIFLSPDPVEFQEGNVFSFNRYAYANNNPYRYVDPNGRQSEDAQEIIDQRRNGALVTATNRINDFASSIVKASENLLPTSGSDVALGIISGGVLGKVAKKVPDITTPYKRPSGATTNAQRESVQGKPCVDCGATTPTQYADHKDPLVEEYYRSGTIDKTRMRDTDSVQPQCPTCSNKQGAKLSRYSRQQKKDRGL